MCGGHSLKLGRRSGGGPRLHLRRIGTPEVVALSAPAIEVAGGLQVKFAVKRYRCAETATIQRHVAENLTLFLPRPDDIESSRCARIRFARRLGGRVVEHRHIELSVGE